MRIEILVLDGVFDTGLATVVDTLEVANALAPVHGLAPAPFAVKMVGLRKHVQTGQGLQVPVGTPLGREGGWAPEVVILPALGAKTPELLTAALGRRDVTEAGELLGRWREEGALICAACTSTFVLAEAGLLNGRRATTTWWLSPLFRRRYPRVELDEGELVVESTGFVTAGAALGHLDLALWLVRRVSPVLAAQVAQYLVVEPKSSQAPFIIPNHLAHADPMVERFERWARRRLAHGFSLATAAREVGASERTLARRLKQVLGKSPLSYFQDLRVERALHLLRTTGRSIDQIAGEVGYADGSTLGTLLRRRIGRGARELRARG